MNQHNRARAIKGYLFVITSAVIFGVMPMLVLFIYADGANSMTVTLLRNLLSAPALAALALVQKKSLRVPRKALPSLGLIALLGCSVTPLLLSSSYNYLASGTATVFHFIYPAAVAVGGFLFLKEKLNKGTLISMLLCVLGICLFYTPGAPLDPVGSILALASGLTYAAYILLLAHFRYTQINGFLFTFYIVTFSSAVMLTVGLISGQLAFPGSLGGWLLCLFVSLIVNVGAVMLFQQGTFLIGGQRAAILSTAEPLTSVLVGALFLQEAVSLQTALGSFCVIAAGVLITLSDFKKAEDSED